MARLVLLILLFWDLRDEATYSNYTNAYSILYTISSTFCILRTFLTITSTNPWNNLSEYSILSFRGSQMTGGAYVGGLGR